MTLPPPVRAPRILLYSPDSFGLGHLRRTLTLSEGLLRHIAGVELLVVTGSPCVSLFPIPEGVGSVKLPSVTKAEGGRYAPRSFTGSLERLLEIRKALLLESYRVFRPELVIVDHKATGLQGEALGLLQAARRDGAKTLLGIRDIVDVPAAVAEEWKGDGVRWALGEGYDRLCVYGTPEVFDPRVEYPLPEGVGDRIEFTGYVVRDREAPYRRPIPSVRPQVLVTTGGGEDGFERIECYLEVLERHPVPWNSVITSGPLLDGRVLRRLRRRARMIENVEFRRFYENMPKLLAECDVVVSMGGYNTAAEVLRSRKPWVLLPRTNPRREQALHAERLAGLGLARTLIDPEPEVLRRAIYGALESGVQPMERIPALEGVDRLCTIVSEMIEVPLTIPARSERDEIVRVRNDREKARSEPSDQAHPEKARIEPPDQNLRKVVS